MIIGALALIALGAILRFAVTAQLAGISLSTVGLILLIIGTVALVIGLVLQFNGRAEDSSSY